MSKYSTPISPSQGEMEQRVQHVQEKTPEPPFVSADNESRQHGQKPPESFVQHIEENSIRAEKEKSPAPDWIIDNITEVSKNAQHVFFIFIALLAYCAISITGTADRQVILNSTVQLPLLDSSVSLDGFFLLAPVLAILTFTYLQLYLQRLYGLIDQLKQNYKALESRRLYPSFLNISEEPEPGFVGILQRSIAQLFLWWLLPLVLLMFSFWYTKKHEPTLSYIVGSYPLIGLLVVIYFWRQRERKADLLTDRIPIKILLVVIIVCDLFLLFYLIPRANSGVLYAVDKSNRSRWTNFLSSWSSVDLSYQVLISEQKKEYDTYWVNLENAHLEGANLTHTILKQANLQKAHLQSSNLTNATLRGAQLEGANFLGAAMPGADLSYAKLSGAHNIDLKELCTVKTLFKAKLDATLAQQVQEACSYLLTEQSQE
jgi:hypothetical protein